MTDFQLCVWLCMEVRARAAEVHNLGVDVYGVDIEDLTVPEHVERLLKWTGLKYDMGGFHDVGSNHGHRNAFDEIAHADRSDKDGTKRLEMSEADMRREFDMVGGLMSSNPDPSVIEI